MICFLKNIQEVLENKVLEIIFDIHYNNYIDIVNIFRESSRESLYTVDSILMTGSAHSLGRLSSRRTCF